MIDGLKPYPAMKDSGVPWLGEVPEHWDVRRLKTMCSRSALYGANVSATSYTATGARFLRTTDITDDGVLRSKGVYLPQDAVSDYLLTDGDLLISRSGTVGRSFLYDANLHGPCAYAGYLVRFVPGPEVLPKYLFLFTKTQSFAGFLGVMAISSTIENVNGEKYANSPQPLPPLSEQAAIVRFLDHADRRMRRYIRAKQKLIKLLEEQKQAIIHRAVTRGLDPTVRLKPSGVEWLGDVPEDWEVWQVGHFAAVGNGSTPSRGNAAYWSDGTYPWLNSSSVNAGMITASQQFVTKAALRECHLPRVPKGSVLVAITGQGKTRGTAAVLMIEATINQHIAFITPRKRGKTAAPDYLRSFFIAAYSELRRLSEDSGSTKGALTCQDLRHFRVVLPPLEEQQRIVQWSQDATAEVEDALSLASREIDLLREYRTRLIADVVMGKLDVREAAARLPDEVEEAEPLEDAEPLTENEEELADDLDLVPEGVEG